MSHSPEDVKKHIKVYITVFAALLVLTVLTVLAAKLNVVFSIGLFIALTLAGIKGALVSGYFMHLTEEKATIVWILILTAVFFLLVFFLPVLTEITKVKLPDVA